MRLMRDTLTLALAFAIMILAMALARGHADADWIARDRYFSWCCGVNDCAAIDPKRVKESPGGFVIDWGGGATEAIPYAEAIPLSIDGRLWVCRKPDMTRRCVFYRPPAM